MKAHIIGCDDDGNPIWHKVNLKVRFEREPYCGDCEHFRVAGFPNRMCLKHPKKHIFALGYSVKIEREENGHTQAEKCSDFTPNVDLQPLPAE